MSKVVQIDDLADTMQKELNSYVEEITTAQKKAVDVVVNEVNESIKSHITFEQPTGDYVKAFRITKAQEDIFGKTKIWYVKKPYYRLTHLLENGHSLVRGGRSRNFPHIKYGQLIAEKRMVELSKEAVENAGR